MTDFEVLGGDEVLRVVVSDFVDRAFSDLIIGFFFQGKDRDRIVEKEIELARVHLGGGGAYTGREVGSVHGPLKINKGQFRRRLALLRKTLEDHDVDEGVRDRWLAHNQSLVDRITTSQDCVD